MPREIKFKVWNKASKKWLEDGTPIDLLYSLKCNAFMFDNDAIDIPTDIEVVEFTGLKDKNGKEIYEGDVLMFSPWNYDTGELDPESMQELLWNEDNLSFYLFPVANAPHVDFYSNEAVGNEYRVIGNIYEHPHLLSTSQDGESKV